MCDPVTAGVTLVMGALSAGAMRQMKTKQAQAAGPAPQRTDADVAQAAEEERRRMSLSTLGFGANFSDKLGSVGSYAPAPVKSLTLG